MHILFLTDNFPPESNAPASRTYEHALHWVAQGNEVTIITCAPNFPSGKLFDGYRNRWYQAETMEGIRVVRVKTYITANEGFIKRTLDYQSFMLMSTIAAIFQRRPDVVIATSPQFFTAVDGYLVSRLRRIPFVFELRDLWPASITAVGAMKPSRIIKWLERLEMFLYRKAALIVAVTEAFKDELQSRGIDPGKIIVVQNGVDLQRYQPLAPSQTLIDELQLNDKFVVGYVGTHGMAHGLPKVVEAAQLMKSDPNVVFLFAGGGAERASLEADVKARNLKNVRLLPMQPKSRMPEVWSVCNLALIPLRDTPLFSSVIPSKLFECMAMGIPVVMSIPEGQATKIVQDTQCGVVIPPEQPTQLVDAIRKLKNDEQRMQKLHENSLKAAKEYSRTRLATLMQTAVSQLLLRVK